MKNTRRTLGILGLGTTIFAASIGIAGCGGNEAQTTNDATSSASPAASESGSTASAGGADMANLKGEIASDGSSTVGPITQAMAEEFGAAAPNVRLTVGISGTGGGFKKFAAGDIVLQNASRAIKSKEAADAKAKGIEFIELPVAYDGIAIVVNPKNTWANDLTVAELKKIWDKGSKLNNWSQVRAGFPSKPLKLYGPGTSSGTFDYFTAEINGEEGQSRADYTASEDDNTLVEGVSRDEGGMAYFGYGYYQENKDKLKLIKVGGIEPTPETVSSGTYKPLSRPLFVYVDRKAAERPEVDAFVKFYIEKGEELVPTVGFVPLHSDLKSAVLKRWEDKTAGTAFSDATKGKTLEAVYGVKPGA